jgi:xanthine/CO dehydrogenase XdhC/CoxF family maturation factor
MSLNPYALRLDPGLEVLSLRLAEVDTPCVLATVISAAGSTYRKPGARMLIEPDGRITGLLSGGCLERDLREHATAILTSGVARTITYDMRADNDLLFGTGAGCDGCVGILLERVLPDSRVARAITTAAACSRAGIKTVMVMIHEGPAEQRGTQLWRSAEHDVAAPPLARACAGAIEAGSPAEVRWADNSGGHAAWVQPVLPLPAVLICGAGPDAEPLAAIFRSLHFPVTVVDHRPAYANPANFPGADVVPGTAASLAARVDLNRFFAAVIMSHHFASDVEYLRSLTATDMAYIGVLGPAARRARLLATLGAGAAALDSRVRGPVGLDIGAVTPEAIALAIAADIYAAAAGRDAKPLRQTKAIPGPIKPAAVR